MPVQFTARRAKRPQQAARRSLRERQDAVRRQLRAALGDRDCAVLLGALQALGAGAERRLAQVLAYRKGRGDAGAQTIDPDQLAHEAVTLLLPAGHTARVQRERLARG